MKFIFQNNRNGKQQAIYESAEASNWHVRDIFSNLTEVCEHGSEKSRMEYAPVLASLAFGEATAFYGFGQRIAEATDISTKTWLITHLNDEARHTEGFSRLLDYLYPSTVGRQQMLLENRDVLVFYGRTHRCEDLLEWLICTQIAEVFGMFCYKQLNDSFVADQKMSNFFSKILMDEARHINYVGSIIDKQKQKIGIKKWHEHYRPHMEKMAKYCRNMFESKKKGANYQSFHSIGIDVTKFCDDAETMLAKKFA